VAGNADFRELSCWRKHPNLQGWMSELWEKKGRPGVLLADSTFNNIELELTWEDIDQLEKDINENRLSQLNTVGFFFGSASDDYHRDKDLEFIKNARCELFMGIRVFYNSSW
jgi:hypothetical protein